MMWKSDTPDVELEKKNSESGKILPKVDEEEMF